MAEMAMAAWAFVKASFAAVAAGTATAGQVATVIAVNVAGSVALSTAATALMKPQAGSRAPGEWVADPNAGIPFAIGPRIGVAGNIVYKNTFGKDNEYKGIVTVHSGAGPIGGYLGFSADREPITFDAEGVQGRYKGEMWMQQRLGNQPDTALTSPASISYKLPDWGPAHRLSGKASSMWTLRMDSKFSVYPQGEPAPLTTLIGIAGYDPRLDSTVPGGLGNCRWDNRATWPTIRNGVIADLNWCLGLRENGKVVGGLGVSMGGVDLPAYMRAANVADANGWTVAAYPRSDENKTEVRAALLQAAGCVISRKAGKVSCITRGAPKTSVMTITADDTAGPVELDTAANVLNRLNSITPRYLEESAGWILAPAAPVSSAVYVDEDKGVLRSDARDYAYVPGARQAAQLAALDVAHSREGIAGRWPLKPYCRDIEVGEVFTVSDPAFLLNNQTMLCLEREYDPASDTVFVTFVSETPGKVAWALGQAANPSPTPALTAWAPLNPPLPTEIVIVPRLPGEDGVEVPVIDVEVTPDNARAELIFIEWAHALGSPPIPASEIEEPELLPWSQAYEGPAVAGSIPVQGPRPGQLIYLSSRYRSGNDGWSSRHLDGPIITPGLVAGDTILLGGKPVADILKDFERLPVALEEIDETAEVLIGEMLDRHETIQKEARERVQQVREEREDREAAVALVEREAREYADSVKAEAFESFVTIAAFGDGLSLTLNQSRSYTDAFKAEAQQTFATQAALGTGLAGTLSTARSYTDALRSDASLTYSTIAQTNSGLATTLSQARSYTDAYKTEATALFATQASMASGLATTLAQARSYTDAYKAEASQIFAAQSSLAGVSSTAALALETAQSAEGKLNEARVRIYAAASGGQPALAEFFSGTGAESRILLSATQIGFVAGTERKPIMVLSGDGVVINTNLVVTGSLQANAITKGASAASTTETNVPVNAWTDLLQVSMNSGGGEVAIDFGAQVSAVNAGGPNASIQVRFMRDGVVLETLQVMDLLGAQTIYVQGSSDPFQTYVQINTVVSTYIHPFTVDVGATAGAHTWKVQMLSGAGATVGAKKMRLLETKR